MILANSPATGQKITMTPVDFAALRALRDQVGSQSHTGVVCYLGDRIISSSDKLWGIPLSALWAR